MRYTFLTAVEFEADSETDPKEYAALLDGARLAYLGDAFDGHDATLRLPTLNGDGQRRSLDSLLRSEP